MITEEIKNRKGARKATDISPNVLQLLNQGKIPTVNLTEWLAVDQTELIKNTFGKIGLSDCIENIKKELQQQKKRECSLKCVRLKFII